MESLDHFLSLHTVVWLLPILFMIHDLEEIISVEAWMARNRADLRRLLPARILKVMERDLSMTTAAFAVAVLFMFMGIAFSTIWGGAALERGGSMLPFSGALAVFFIHSFTHIGQAVFLRRYTPGVLTSVVIVIPYSLYAYYRLLDEGIMTWQTAWLGVPVGFISAAILLMAGHKAGKIVEPKLNAK